MSDDSVYYDKLSLTKMKIITTHTLGFYTFLFLNFPIEESEEVESIATNGYNIFINKEWFLNAPEDERVYGLTTLILHNALGHTVRRLQRDKKLWAAASDIVVNLLLAEYEMPKPSRITLYPNYGNLSVEQVYEKLKQEPEDSPQTEPDYQDQEPEMQSKQKGQSDSKQSQQDIQNQLNEAMVTAKIQQEASAKDSSKLGIPKELEDIFRKLEKPKLPWSRILRKQLQSKAKEDYSFRKPNRRFKSNLILPSLHSEGLSRIDFIIDTSGSIFGADFAKMLSEVDKVLKEFHPKEIGLSQFDHEYRGTEIIDRFTDASKIALKGGGGTNIEKTLETVDSFNTQLIIVFTDGYMNLNLKKPKHDVLWVVYNNNNFKPPFGKAITYELYP